MNLNLMKKINIKNKANLCIQIAIVIYAAAIDLHKRYKTMSLAYAK